MGRGPGRMKNIYVNPKNEAILREAEEMAKKRDLAFSELVFQALEDYVSLYQKVWVRR